MFNFDARMGRGHFLGVLDVKNRGGGILWVYWVKKIYIWEINTSSCKEHLKRGLARGNI